MMSRELTNKEKDLIFEYMSYPSVEAYVNEYKLSMQETLEYIKDYKKERELYDIN